MRTRLYSGILAFTLVLAAGRTGAAEKQPVQVFILVGQSNMQGHGNVEVGRNPADPKAADRNVRNIAGGLGSLRCMVLDRPDLYGPGGSTPLVDESGKWRVRDDVWIWSNTDKGECGKLTVGYGVNEYIGPEFGFGHVLGTYLEAPVLIIKTSWGGKDLAVDFRTPSAGKIPYKLGAKRQQALEKDPKLIGSFYREMLAHVREITNHVEKYVPELAGRKMEIAGIGWHQGWNDGCNTDEAAEYEHNMAHFIRDMRREIGKPNLPFVIGGSGFGGANCKGRRLTVLQAQLAMADSDKYPEFKGNVAAVDTRPFWREELQSPAGFGYHWNLNGETHYLIGEGMGQAMVKLLQAAPQAISQADRPAQKAKPNILFVLLDDLGWKDIGCQGNPRVDTPHIDRLAQQGMRFTDAYAASPVCSPTRAAVLTGLSPARLRITNHIPDQKGFIPDGAKVLPAEMLDHLPLERVTVAERLQKAGYVTGFFGKWHLAGRAMREGRGLIEFYPEHQGFAVNVGGCATGGPSTYFDPYSIHTLPDRRKGEYLTDRLADEVIGFMRTNRDRPFLAFLWHYAVHWPMEAPADLIRKYESRVGPGVKDPRYAAMTEAMDTSMGKILDALDDLGLRDNTIVIFTSDNGPFLGVADAKPLREGKGYLYEGGIRVPLIVRWPGRVQPGLVCHEPVVSMDFYPTILEAAGISRDASELLDGESLTPLLTQTGGLKRQSIYFHYPNYAFHRSNRLGGAVRKGDYKLLEFFDDASVELYNLREDEGETRDLSAKLPDVAESLRSELAQWRETSGAAMPRRADAGQK